MSGFDFVLGSARLTALASGALWWRDEAVLVVSDLHFGKSERLARVGGTLLPPYETVATLHRLDAEIAATGARTIICLGDSFDDLAAADLPDPEALWLTRLMAGRRWIWIEGNHDPGPVGLGGEHLSEVLLGDLVFRHIAAPAAEREVSGHFHPKARIRFRGTGLSRPCFLIDARRVIMPAFGTYTGGLSCEAPVLRALMGPGARAVLTGTTARAIPVPD